MRVARYVCVVCMIALGVLAVTGCGKGADEDKPLSEVRAEADTMSVDALKAAALKYKKAIAAKEAEVEKSAAKIKEIPIAEALSEEAQERSGRAREVCHGADRTLRGLLQQTERGRR